MGNCSRAFCKTSLLVQKAVTENLKVVLQIQDIGMLFLLGGAVILVALCCSILPILRANPKDILAKMEG